MAFNFNWSPLTADADFYQRARDLLTTALNKNPKPPIIVDDILVTEFNLGSVPPDLEILEIGDLAEDRFRGIFKMCYSGDAFLTLKTRVQANPLNTYLSAKPSFTSPQPLAAASGLTIPLSITLSEIKLSAFIILVFSKQKGLTIVFRNDPLESLKVSSTFDSIQFVRDYLQRTIEGQLRNLMMDELPAIIHKLSLRLFCPDQLPKDENESVDDLKDEAVIDPLATPPLDPVDSKGNLLDANEISRLSLEGSSETQSLFSYNSLMRLSTLTDSQRTLSLHTPSIRDVMVRAWAGQADRYDTMAHNSPTATPSLVRSHTYGGTATTYSFTDASSMDNGSISSRPSQVSLHSATTGLGLGAGRHPRASRKKKTRVVNLRRNKINSENTSEVGDMDTSSDTTSVQGPLSEPILPTSIPEEPENESTTQQYPTPSRVRFQGMSDKAELPTRPALNMNMFEEPTKTSSVPIRSVEKAEEAGYSRAEEKLRYSRGPGSDTSSVILEQAWISKMAGEIARRVYDEKMRNENFWANRDDTPPPAYEATQ